jgi:hypothetical protein
MKWSNLALLLSAICGSSLFACNLRGTPIQGAMLLPKQVDTITYDYENSHLEDHHHDATGIILKCHEQQCDVFDPAAKYTYIPVFEHCGSTDRKYFCGGDDDDFTKFRGHPYVDPVFGTLSASFIDYAEVITAGHNLSLANNRAFMLMDAAFASGSWATVTPSEDSSCRFSACLKVETKYILKLDHAVACEHANSNHRFDWAIYEVRPFAAGQDKIPPHSTFTLSTESAPADTPIVVLHHPRMLSLKRSNGRVTLAAGSVADRPEAMFDSSGGSSGAPILDASGDMILGIVNGKNSSAYPRDGSGRRGEINCAKRSKCPFQPFTSSHRIALARTGPLDGKLPCNQSTKETTQ